MLGKERRGGRRGERGTVFEDRNGKKKEEFEGRKCEEGRKKELNRSGMERRRNRRKEEKFMSLGMGRRKKRRGKSWGRYAKRRVVHEEEGGKRGGLWVAVERRGEGRKSLSGWRD